jgi:trafficking protein particle complex subunit 10
VLRETETTCLPVSIGSKDDNTDSSSKMRPLGGGLEEFKVSMAEPKTMIHPARTSMAIRRASLNEPPYAITPAGGRVVYEHESFPGTPLPTGGVMAQGTAADLEELAAHRAELYLIQRRLVEHMGKSKGWKIGWAAINASQSKDRIVDVSLDNFDASDKAGAAKSNEEIEVFSEKGLLVNELIDAVEKLEAFQKCYEVSVDAARIFLTFESDISAETE